MKQNIYDQTEFFNQYSKLRKKTNNHNNLIEQPAFESLLPVLNGLTILDLGCGNGQNSKKLIERNADYVLGVDISSKMLSEARKLETNNLKFIQLPMEDISSLSKTFDVVVSSLAFHYVQDFDRLLHDINQLLNPHGYLIFSQEHPLASCYDDKHLSRWTKDDKGKKIHANVSDYMVSGARKSTWFDTEIIKYHRPFAEIINGLIEADFDIEKIIEAPDHEMDFGYNSHRPDFLLVRAIKRNN